MVSMDGDICASNPSLPAPLQKLYVEAALHQAQVNLQKLHSDGIIRATKVLFFPLLYSLNIAASLCSQIFLTFNE